MSAVLRSLYIRVVWWGAGIERMLHVGVAAWVMCLMKRLTDCA